MENSLDLLRQVNPSGNEHAFSFAAAPWIVRSTGPIFYFVPMLAMTINLKRYRVEFQGIDYYTIDVLASSVDNAVARAECIDLDHFTHRERDGVWEASDAYEVTSESFNPPELPASSWIGE